MALFENDFEAAKKLLEADSCNVEACDQLGWRPLHRAAFAGGADVMRLLLERKPDIAARDLDGLQPLHVAASGGHVECCRLLLHAGARATAPDNNGLTAQMYSLMCNGDCAPKMREVFGVSPDDMEKLVVDEVEGAAGSLRLEGDLAGYEAVLGEPGWYHHPGAGLFLHLESGRSFRYDSGSAQYVEVSEEEMASGLPNGKDKAADADCRDIATAG
eukprot:TRINITY_DN27526_c0_g1_i2.p1 TRINITY_DN27526_c0_g1~~TRINITY_DN27526_c0_g1_i2.p1  ORF type:complete len:216 (+),score=43.32 TRINITY_DN27526_c0_g1_i2:145-792(+)